MANLRERAEKYTSEHPFTLAGFSKAEVELIQSAYRDAYSAGFREAILSAVEKSKGGGSCYYDCGDWIRGEILSLVIGPEPSSLQVGT